MLPAIRGERPDAADRARFSELGVGPELRSAVVGDHHIIEGWNHRMLFDWRADPKEQTDLATTQAHRVAELGQVLMENARLRLKSPLKAKAGLIEGLDEDLKRRLRALGYAR